MYGQVYLGDTPTWETGLNARYSSVKRIHSDPVVVLPIKSFKQRYSTVSELGSGSFGSVMLVKLKHGLLREIQNEMNSFPFTLMQPLPDSNKANTQVFAVKTLTQRVNKLCDYSRAKEIKFIYSVKSHPSLVQVYEIFIDKDSLKLHIVMEALDQNLYQLMKARKSCLFSSVTLKSILSQILAGIRHIHKYLYYHRDVKPENILVMHKDNYYESRELIPPARKNDNYIVKLADFGLARRADNLKPYTAYVSTRWYRSPEILLRQKHYSYPVDMWAFGCVAVEAATFSPLFPGSNELDQTWRVLEVLGSPCVSSTGFVPLGGVWKDATRLSALLGFHLPNVTGLNVESLVLRNDLPDEERQHLCDLVKACLVWDPEMRVTAERLCRFPYFDNTVIREEDASLEMEETNANLDSFLSNSSQDNQSSFLDQSLLFAGIPHVKTPKQKYLNMSYPIKDTLGPFKMQNDENEMPYEVKESVSHSNHHHSLRKMPQINSNILSFLKHENSNRDKDDNNSTKALQNKTEKVSYEDNVISDAQHNQPQQLDEIQKIDAALKSLEEDSEFEQDGNRYPFGSPSSNVYDLNGNQEETHYQRGDYSNSANYLNLVNSYFNNPDSSFDSHIRIVDAVDEDEDDDLKNLGIDALSCLMDDEFPKNTHLYSWSPADKHQTKYTPSSLGNDY